MVRPTPIRFALIVVIVLFVFTGCATTRKFDLLPQETEDFELEYTDLSEKYTEIPKYETVFRGFPLNTPYIDDLIEVWGPADYERTQWYQLGLAGGCVGGLYLLTSSVLTTGIAAGVILILDPIPPKTFVWNKGSYCIEVSTITVFHYFSYRRRIQYWEWTDMRKEEEISGICKDAMENKNE